jgi:hypothetical protein
MQVFDTPDQIAAFQRIVIANGLKMYAKCGMMPNRAYTPKAMMAAATELTGKKFKARDYLGAAQALLEQAGVT